MIALPSHALQSGDQRSLSVDLVVQQLAYFDHIRCGRCPHDCDEDKNKPALVLMRIEYDVRDQIPAVTRKNIFMGIQTAFKDTFL